MKLFVYGTLLRKESNHQVLKGAMLLYTGGMLQAKMYDTGNGYPAIELAGGSTIVGDIYEIPDHMWVDLDDLEGYTGNSTTDLYSKEIVKVQTVDGLIEAVVYTICDESMKVNEILSGDWTAYRQSRYK
ncbi:MAG TPA: gamma-glutamylcyclotransferase family protein [Paenisporosarcina sp.]|nr:gamma-glutamylcyclotransferase family protein [Paenisporosarcina sp.]